MKKLLLFAAIVIGLGIVCSCSNEDAGEAMTEVTQSVDASDDVALEGLVNSMKVYNDSCQESLTVIGATSPRKSWLKNAFKWLCVAAADALGYSVGNLGTGAGASGVAYILLFSDKGTITPYVHAGSGSPAFASSVAVADSVGYNHNLVLANCLSDSVRCLNLSHMAQEEQIDAILAEVKTVTGKDYEVSTSAKNTVIDIANSVAAAMNESESYDDFCEKLNASQPVNIYYLNIVEEYMRGIQSCETEDDYIRYYYDMRKLLEDAKLTPKELQQFLGTFSVANASAHLWKDLEL